jgi:hypothetical protein
LLFTIKFLGIGESPLFIVDILIGGRVIALNPPTQMAGHKKLNTFDKT